MTGSPSIPSDVDGQGNDAETTAISRELLGRLSAARGFLRPEEEALSSPHVRSKSRPSRLEEIFFQTNYEATPESEWEELEALEWSVVEGMLCDEAARKELHKWMSEAAPSVPKKLRSWLKQFRNHLDDSLDRIDLQALEVERRKGHIRALLDTIHQVPSASRPSQVTRDLEQLEKIRARIFRRNLRLVKKIVGERASLRRDLDASLVSGAIGLLHGIDRFDRNMGFMLSTFAFAWTRQLPQRMMDSFGHAIRVPVHLRSQLMNFILEHWGRNEIEIEGKPADQKTQTMQHLIQSYTRQSFCLPSGRCAGAELIDPFLPTLHERRVTEKLHRVIEGELQRETPRNKRRKTAIDERACDIIERRIGLGRTSSQTLEEVAIIHGVTRERIRQIAAASFQLISERPLIEMRRTYSDLEGSTPITPPMSSGSPSSSDDDKTCPV